MLNEDVSNRKYLQKGWWCSLIAKICVHVIEGDVSIEPPNQRLGKEQWTNKRLQTSKLTLNA